MPDHTYVSYWFHSKATGARVEWEAGAYRAFNKHGTGAGELSGGVIPDVSEIWDNCLIDDDLCI